MKEILDKQFGNYRVIAIEYEDTELDLKEAEKQRNNFIKWNCYEANEDCYIGSVRDVAVGNLLASHLRSKLKIPFLDCEAHEESSYGLPEFSIYYNQDARSWCGKWTYDDSPESLDETGVFFGLIGSDEPEYEQIQKIIENLNGKYAVAILIGDD